MGVEAVSNNVATAYSSTVKADSKAEKTESAKSKTFDDTAAVYEKSNSNDSVISKNPIKMTAEQRTAFVQKLKEDQASMQANFLSIVQKTIAGQGNTFSLANLSLDEDSDNSVWKYLAEGNFTADADTIAKAKEDISENGYWGVDQTSSRIVDFAIALSGNNTEKAELMINAFKKGFDQATKAWGKDLPDISSKTYDAVMDKFDSWKNGTYRQDEE